MLNQSRYDDDLINIYNINVYIYIYIILFKLIYKFSFLTARPVISVNPIEARVGINGSVSFECKASGNPIPTTYWTHEGTGVVVGTGQTWGEGRVFVDSHNTLTIRSITKDDEVSMCIILLEIVKVGSEKLTGNAIIKLPQF